MKNLEKAKELKELFNLEKEKKVFDIYKVISTKAKELLKEIEKGCGKTFGLGISKHICGENWFCSDCKEAKKICEEILQ